MSKKFRTIGDVQYSENQLRGMRNCEGGFEESRITKNPILKIITKETGIDERGAKKASQSTYDNKKRRETEVITNRFVNDFLVEEFMIKEAQFVYLLHARAQNLIEKAKEESDQE